MSSGGGGGYAWHCCPRCKLDEFIAASESVELPKMSADRRGRLLVALLYRYMWDPIGYNKDRCLSLLTIGAIAQRCYEYSDEVTLRVWNATSFRSDYPRDAGLLQACGEFAMRPTAESAADVMVHCVTRWADCEGDKEVSGE